MGMVGKRYSFIIAVMAALLLAVPPVSAALAVEVSQSGADSGEVMKGLMFTVTASGWSGTCSQAMISFDGCSSCSLSGEETQKTVGQGQSVSWTTAVAGQKATDQTVSVTMSGGGECSGSGPSTPFDIVLPPSLTLDATTDDSSVSKGSTFDVNIEITNNGETTANDITVAASTGFTADCDPISSVDEGQSAGESCTVSTASSMSGGSRTVTLTVSSTNADDATDTLSIYVSFSCGDGYCDPGETSSNCAADCGGGDGGDGGDGGFGPGPTLQNRTMRPTLVPGVGLRNNTKLQATIEKVLAKGKMSEQARENLLRLSASIISDISATRMFNASGTKSRVTTRMKYTGQKRVRNFILFESIPKTFANNASLVDVTAPAGTRTEIAEEDPSWVIYFSTLNTGQEFTVTYEVTGIKSSSVIDGMTTEVYAESLEEAVPPVPTQICTAGTKRCLGDSLQQCSGDGTKWETLESCVYGCDSAALKCKEKPAALPTGIEEIPWTLVAGVVIVAALVVVAAVVYLKKFRKAGGGSPVSALQSVKQNLGQQAESEESAE